MNAIPLFSKLLVELQSNCNRNCFFCNRPNDKSGKRLKAGKRVIEKMPNKLVYSILDQAYDLGFKGYIAFHHMSEAFLDKRIIEIASTAKYDYRFIPYAHTNGDILRKDETLSKEAAKIFEYIVMGLYDYKTKKERKDEEKFWLDRLKGTTVKFSYVGNVYPRAHTDDCERFKDIKHTYPNGVCSRPFKRLIVHYDGGIALCCEDMEEDFDLGNAFNTPIKDLWFSKKHARILNDLNKGDRSKYKLCFKCPIKPNNRKIIR